MCDIERAIDHEINVPDYLIYLFKRTLSTQTQTLTYAKQARDVTNSYKLSLSDRVGIGLIRRGDVFTGDVVDLLTSYSSRVKLAGIWHARVLFLFYFWQETTH